MKMYDYKTMLIAFIIHTINNDTIKIILTSEE